MKDIVIIKNSNTLLNNDVYFPDINEIENGELLLNNSVGKETLFIKNDADNIILFRSKQYTLDKINASIPTITVSDTAPNKPKEGDFWIEPMPPIPFTLEFDVLADDLSITLPISGNVNCEVDWGDGGTKETIASDRPSHNYSSSGIYVVKVYGDFERMNRCSTNVTKVISWGNSNTLLTNMDRAFSNCSKLTSIPDDEYEAFINVTTFYLTFYYCTSLTSIPENLFQYSFKAEQIHNTFNHCSGLTGNTPTGTDGLELWERAGQHGYPSTITGVRCFEGCSKLSNYSSIPSRWKQAYLILTIFNENHSRFSFFICIFAKTLINGFATPAYLYIEGEEVEKYWLDSQNLYYHVSELIDEDTNLINGKNWNIIEPLKIKGVKVTKENNKEVIKYFVTECSNESDYNKEWNFKEHKVIND